MTVGPEGTARPVPVRGTVTAPPEAFPETVTEAVLAPTVLGVKRTTTGQLVAAARVAAHPDRSSW